MAARGFKQGENKSVAENLTFQLDRGLMERLKLKLSKYESIMAESSLFKETIKILEYRSITHIRCLALGSPSDSNAALYQLAFLTQVCREFDVNPSNVSLYDPVFNELDNQFLTTVTNFKITEKDTFIDLKTLYFLPHASLELTEQVLNDSKPSFLLANDIISHTDRLTKKKIHDTYRTISLLIKVLENAKITPKESDDFVSVTLKKKKNRNKRPVFKEPEIEYDYANCYFKTAELIRIENAQGIWGNSFSDIAFHRIIRNATFAKNQE